MLDPAAENAKALLEVGPCFHVTRGRGADELVLTSDVSELLADDAPDDVFDLGRGEPSRASVRAARCHLVVGKLVGLFEQLDRDRVVSGGLKRGRGALLGLLDLRAEPQDALETDGEPRGRLEEPLHHLLWGGHVATLPWARPLVRKR